MSKQNLKAFVTGGTGFIGSRLVEVLVDDFKADVRVLAHRTSPGALRIAPLGVEFDFTPIIDAEGLARGMEGADVVFHLAYGKFGGVEDTRETTVDGTQAVIAAALKARVKHFVNVSTAAVYFGVPNGVVDETAPRRKWGWSYADQKLEAEELVRKAVRERRLPGSIFEVAGVYGPWGETFVMMPLAQMRQGMMVLPNQGRGIANLTYVDDVVQAILLGMKDEATGETFLVKGPGTVTRREAAAELEKMLGYKAAIGMDNAAIRGAVDKTDWRTLGQLLPAALGELKKSDHFKDLLRKSPLMPVARMAAKRLRRGGGSLVIDPEPVITDAEVPLVYPQKIMIDYLSAEVEFNPAKAARLLGFTPRYSLDEGMGITRDWADWANLLGPRHAA